MITFNKLGEYGRLGNQLFQYAILVAVSEKTGYEIKLPNYNNKTWHGQKCLLNNFNISAGYIENHKIVNNYIEKPNNNYIFDSNVFKVKDNTNFHGFFQNYLYYVDCVDKLIEELTPKKEIIDLNLKRLNKIKRRYKDHDIISLHIRRGDTNLKMFGNGQDFDKSSKWYRYLESVKEVFKGKKVKYLVFTGGDRKTDDPNNDYNWCRRNLNTDEYIYHDFDNQTINDFTLMYLCDGHVLSPTSTLSWWVGFLNIRKIGKFIVAPKKYYFLEKEMNEGFYPEKFILV